MEISGRYLARRFLNQKQEALSKLLGHTKQLNPKLQPMGYTILWPKIRFF